MMPASLRRGPISLHDRDPSDPVRRAVELAQRGRMILDVAAADLEAAEAAFGPFHATAWHFRNALNEARRVVGPPAPRVRGLVWQRWIWALLPIDVRQRGWHKEARLLASVPMQNLAGKRLSVHQRGEKRSNCSPDGLRGRDGFPPSCSVMAQLPPSSDVCNTALTPAAQASHPATHPKASRGRMAGIRSVMREMRALAGVVTMTNVWRASWPCSHSSQITAMAMDCLSWGAITHCLVLPLGSSSPSSKGHEDSPSNTGNFCVRDLFAGMAPHLDAPIPISGEANACQVGPVIASFSARSVSGSSSRNSRSRFSW